jgi:hypothetical protein
MPKSKPYYSRSNALCEKYEMREQEKWLDRCKCKPFMYTPSPTTHTKWGCYLEQGDVDKMNTKQIRDNENAIKNTE